MLSNVQLDIFLYNCSVFWGELKRGAVADTESHGPTPSPACMHNCPPARPSTYPAPPAHQNVNNIECNSLTCSFGLQSLLNIFSSLALIPTKGMTLPFVSYGGSSMLSSAILFGYLLSLTKKKYEEK